MIVDETGNHAEVYMHCIQRQGACYGLSLNWDKLMMICINCNPSIAKPNGSHVRIAHSMIYFGGLISNVNVITLELNHHIAMTYNDLRFLHGVWFYANMIETMKTSIDEDF